MTVLVVALVAAALVAATMVFARYSKHPEQTAGHGTPPDDTTSDRFYRGVDRPAGPDVELDPSGPPPQAKERP